MTIAIGALGGSGTRVAANFLRGLGVHIGGHLNESLDNLWFTLLFKRRSVLLETDEGFAALARLFIARMTGPAPSGEVARRLIQDCAARPRMDLDADFLHAAARSFLEAPAPAPGLWGWKEPNTHVVIERWLGFAPDLRYLHFERDPFYMAASLNQNQPRAWGPLLLDRPFAPGPGYAFAYWCAVHRRVEAMRQRAPDRVAILRYDDLLRAPDSLCDAVARLGGIAVAPEARAALHAEIAGRAPPRSEGLADVSDIDGEDLAYARAQGYAPHSPS